MCILKYLAKRMRDSLLCYDVNGNPEKRRFCLLNMAAGVYNRMTKSARVKLYNIIKKH